MKGLGENIAKSRQFEDIQKAKANAARTSVVVLGIEHEGVHGRRSPFSVKKKSRAGDLAEISQVVQKI